MVIVAYFYRAFDARLAISALSRLGALPGMPQPLGEPVNGRDWKVEIGVSSGSLSDRYAQPVLVDEVVGTILRFNGTTEVPSRV